MLSAIWSGFGSLSSCDHVGWWRLKSPVMRVACCGRMFVFSGWRILLRRRWGCRCKC